MAKGVLRLVLFADPTMASSMTMLAASLKCAAAREDVEVVAIVDTARQAPSPLRLPRALVGLGIRGVCNLNIAAQPEDKPLLATCASLARRWQVELLEPRASGVNDPGFIETVQRLQAGASVALMVAQIFRQPLLEACGTPVNYHNGLLPRYQGVAATGWSIYEHAPRSGFSFHLMTEAVDQGPILLQGSVPLGPQAVAAAVERAKTQAAAAELNGLLDLLASPATSSVKPEGPGSCFTRADLRAIQSVEEPQKLSLDELELRLRAFETVNLTLAGRRWSTTALRRVGRRPHNRRLAFMTADGVRVEPSRLLHLPPVVYRSLRSVHISV